MDQQTGSDWRSAAFKTHQRGPDVVLRSKTPDEVRQEIYGQLCAHYAIRSLIGPVAAEGIVPERTVQLEDLATQWLPEMKRCAAEISRRLRPSG